MSYQTQQIRNIALLGHTGSGKTSLTEAILYAAGACDSKGELQRGTTLSDFTPQEKQHLHSLEPSMLNLDYEGNHINLLDTPGLPDFFGRSLSVLPAVETVALVVHAQKGCEAITDRAFAQLKEQNKCGMIIINQLDSEGVDPEAILASLQERFEVPCLPLNLPSADLSRVIDCFFEPDYDADTAFSSIQDAHDALVDQVVEEDDELMELYLEQGESLSPEQLHEPFEKALRRRHMLPVCFTSATGEIGIQELLTIFSKLLPNPLEANPPAFVKGWGEKAKPVEVTPDPQKHLLAHVFKITVDPFIGRLGVFRVHQGTMTNGERVFISEERKPIKIGHLLKLQGGKQLEVPKAIPGDICALAKIDALEVNVILHDSHEEDEYHMPDLSLPDPLYGLAVKATKRGDEQKITEVLHKLAAEDPSLRISQNEQANETILNGLGEMHLKIVLEKAKDLYNLDIDTDKPSVAYRETISSKAEGHHRHKKQTGGAGQFGEVFLRIEPLPRGEGFVFESAVVGGSIPSQFIPAVEKGVREVLGEGAVAGYPLQDVKVIVYDGKHHPVDSKEIAFVSAGKKAFLNAIEQARPVVLEPIVKMLVSVPAENVGDITGDLASMRGIVCGSNSQPNNRVEVEAEAPLANLDDYATRLKAMTGGEGEFSVTFSRYEAVPAQIQQQLTAEPECA
ncbi:elongation factor G [Dongshaea marina]|uniref:elongation factor G n=1 Tax=Dongshaea marina TaxID=2047966 RepID=UPI000D3EA57D|nr:elongation factor G [Dongshaea marina]